MRSWMRYAALVLCLISPAVHGETPDGGEPAAGAALPSGAGAEQRYGELWLNPGFYAYHFQRERHLNDHAYGFGAEYRFSETGAITAGTFRNSNWAHSHYLAYYWRPLKYGPVRLGVVAGLLDGYPGTRKGGWFPGALPTASLEYGRVGLNMFYIPSYKDRINGSITLQLKLRIF